MNVISNTTIITDSLASWHKSQSTFQFQGHDIAYHVQGKEGAPCLLLIHGYPTASWDWHNQWAALTQHFKVFTLDMLGFGFSDKPQNVTYTIIMQADLLTHFLNLFNVKATHILSHDYGDTVAQELLARSNLNEPHAIKIQSVCFLNGGLFPETHKPVLLQKLLLSPIGALVSRLANYKSFKRNFDNICATPLAEKELKELWQLIAYKQGKPVMAKLIYYITERKLHRARWVSALQQADIPMRLICGMDDPVSGRHMVKRYRELIINPDIIELEGVGHYPQLEQPNQVIKCFIEFHRLKVTH
ncbi:MULTISPECIES: alpha/beta fold hydrolase [unclassified Pseudoalteromonas]|uniref:alpha/beta fold hydrolase n=1 Tax=unclassified Pseudoalteromonas TaxID=194690 RepID=UPI00030DAC63|nr:MULTISPECIES: alpha/beta hydrolase [unclassified Pseudoalteromonas]KGK03154.1 hypothetical protein ND6B_0305 [Pseudoalteromonas sp. ND6B]